MTKKIETLIEEAIYQQKVLNICMAIIGAISLSAVFLSYFLYIPSNCDSLLFGRELYQERYNENPMKYVHLSHKVKGVQNNIICENKIGK